MEYGVPQHLEEDNASGLTAWSLTLFTSMTELTPVFYFDSVDPLSFLMDREVRFVEEATGVLCRRLPLELRPAPAELADASHPLWAPRWHEATRLITLDGADLKPEACAQSRVSLHVPKLVPRSRKAHEFLLHAEAVNSGLGRAALDSVFTAFLVDGRDIGRVDVLVELGRALGLDHTETKAVLDVDRYEIDAAHFEAHANAAGIRGPACLVAHGRRLEGFHNQSTIGTFLAST